MRNKEALIAFANKLHYRHSYSLLVKVKKLEFFIAAKLVG